MHISPLILIIICLAAGFYLNKIFAKGSALPSDSFGAALNIVVIYVALPAMTMAQIHRLHVDPSLLMIATGPWLNFIVAALFWSLLGPRLGWNRSVIGMMILGTGLGNTSFLGFPMIEALLGADALPLAVISDQLGSFLVVSTLGIFTANLYGTSSGASMTRRILSFPPFIATIIALATKDLQFSDGITSCLDRLAALLTPLALMSVGSRLSIQRADLVAYRYQLAAGLSFKMLVIPILTLLALKSSPLKSEGYDHVMILEAAMPGMITGYLVGAERGLDSKLGALMISLGIAIAMITIPAWAWFLKA
jgi:predicted permease